MKVPEEMMTDKFNAISRAQFLKLMGGIAAAGLAGNQAGAQAALELRYGHMNPPQSAAGLARRLRPHHGAAILGGFELRAGFAVAQSEEHDQHECRNQTCSEPLGDRQRGDFGG